MSEDITYDVIVIGGGPGGSTLATILARAGRRCLILEDGLTLKNISVPPEDAQFLETRQFQIPEIARWFNNPNHNIEVK